MKAVILAGGFGTRISEESALRPKPMVEIGGLPILWHIMKYFSCFGVKEFIICLGYKSYMIKEYFNNYFLHQSDVTINLEDGSKQIHSNYSENWKVSLIDTGLNTMTGGRLKRIRNYLSDQPFYMTYGDGVSNVNLADLLDTHFRSNKLVTVTAVQPSGRFGSLNISSDDTVKSFIEKPKGDGSWINGGFFVIDPKALDYVDGDHTVWEDAPLINLAKDSQLHAFKHRDFWHPMDTLRDKNYLHDLVSQNKAPWMIWQSS